MKKGKKYVWFLLFDSTYLSGGTAVIATDSSLGNAFNQV